MGYDCSSNFTWIKLLVLILLLGSGVPAASAQTAEEANQKAAAALTAGKLDAAVSELQASARRFPDDTHIQFNLGLALVRKGQLKEAIAPLQKAAKNPALAVEAHFLLGADYFETADYAKATRELSGLENSGHSERVLYMIEESNRRTQHIEEAKGAFHQLITRYPDSAWTHYLLGTAYEDQKQLDKAIAEYKLALEKDPAIPNADFAIGYIYWRQQYTENAREWLGKEALKGCHALANYYLGEISRTEGDLRNAEARYKRAIECDPSNGDAHVRLGIVMGDQKRYQDAILQLKQAIRLQPNESSAHYHLASIYSRMGRAAEAAAEYKRVREIQAAKGTGADATRGSKQ